MPKQLDLFSASRTTSYRNSHTEVPRRLRTTGAGNKRIERMVNRLNGRQSMRVNRQALANGGAHAGMASHGLAGGRFRVTSGGSSRKSSSGHNGG